MLLIYRAVVILYAARYIMSPQHAVEYPGGTVDSYMRPLPHQGIDKPHMVGMVVREYYPFYRIHPYPETAQFGLDLHGVNPRINQYPAVRRTYIRTIPGGAGTKRDEPQLVNRRRVFHRRQVIGIEYGIRHSTPGTGTPGFHTELRSGLLYRRIDRQRTAAFRLRKDRGCNRDCSRAVWTEVIEIVKQTRSGTVIFRSFVVTRHCF